MKIFNTEERRVQKGIRKTSESRNTQDSVASWRVSLRKE